MIKCYLFFLTVIENLEIGNKQDICTKIIEKSGKLLKTENWGLLTLSHKIKKNRKGIFVHFKFESNSQAITEIEKKLSIENKIIRFLTVKYDKLDLKKNYFEEIKKDKWEEIKTKKKEVIDLVPKIT